MTQNNYPKFQADRKLLGKWNLGEWKVKLNACLIGLEFRREHNFSSSRRDIFISSIENLLSFTKCTEGLTS